MEYRLDPSGYWFNGSGIYICAAVDLRVEILCLEDSAYRRFSCFAVWEEVTSQANIGHGGDCGREYAGQLC